MTQEREIQRNELTVPDYVASRGARLEGILGRGRRLRKHLAAATRQEPTAGFVAAVTVHCLLGSAPIATGDRIEMECSAQIQNTHLNLGREFGGVAEKLRHGVGEQCGL